MERETRDRERKRQSKRKQKRERVGERERGTHHSPFVDRETMVGLVVRPQVVDTVGPSTKDNGYIATFSYIGVPRYWVVAV